MKYTNCPAGCGAAVGIREHNQINFCCSPCFAAYWAAMTWDGTGDDPVPAHSGQCSDRQAGRVDVPRESGEYTLVSKPRRDKLAGLGQSEKA